MCWVKTGGGGEWGRVRLTSKVKKLNKQPKQILGRGKTETPLEHWGILGKVTACGSLGIQYASTCEWNYMSHFDTTERWKCAGREGMEEKSIALMVIACLTVPPRWLDRWFCPTGSGAMPLRVDAEKRTDWQMRREEELDKATSSQESFSRGYNAK